VTSLLMPQVTVSLDRDHAPFVLPPGRSDRAKGLWTRRLPTNGSLGAPSPPVAKCEGPEQRRADEEPVLRGEQRIDDPKHVDAKGQEPRTTGAGSRSAIGRRVAAA